MRNGLQQEEEEGPRRKGRRAGRDKGDKGRPVEARNTHIHTCKHTHRQEKKKIAIKIASSALMNRLSTDIFSVGLPKLYMLLS